VHFYLKGLGSGGLVGGGSEHSHIHKAPQEKTQVKQKLWH